MFIAYLIENTVNGKVYIGVTVRSLHKRWQQHVWQSKGQKKQHKMARAIRKYGAEAFVVTHIASSWSAAALREMEIILIAQFDSFRNGYNGTLGGDGGTGHRHTDDVRRRQSLAKIGYQHTAEARKKMSVTRKGTKHSAQTRERMSAHAKLQISLAGGQTERLKKATQNREQNAEANRAAGITARRIYAEPLSQERTRVGTSPIRSHESRERMKAARISYLETHPLGGRENSSKITTRQAAEIKWLLQYTNFTGGKIASFYPVGQAQVSNIKTGLVWKNVEAARPRLTGG